MYKRQVHCIDSRIRDKCTTRDRNFRSLSHARIIGRTVKDQSGARNDIAGISNHTSDVSSCLKLAAGDGDSSCACYNTSSASDIEGTTGNFDLILPGGIDPTGNIATAFNAAIEGATLDAVSYTHLPEVSHTEYGTRMLHNFLYEVCGARGTWSMADYKNTAIGQIREQVGQGRVLLALSGGVDSSVCAALLALSLIHI